MLVLIAIKLITKPFYYLIIFAYNIVAIPYKNFEFYNRFSTKFYYSYADFFFENIWASRISHIIQNIFLFLISYFLNIFAATIFLYISFLIKILPSPLSLKILKSLNSKRLYNFQKSLTFENLFTFKNFNENTILTIFFSPRLRFF
jgi:hypothetical protein